MQANQTFLTLAKPINTKYYIDLFCFYRHLNKHGLQDEKLSKVMKFKTGNRPVLFIFISFKEFDYMCMEIILTLEL